jgi:hypothetical protein
MKTRYSIDVRCRLTSGRRVFWTAAIRNPQALAALKRFYVRSGWTVEVFDDAGNLAIADACLDIGEGRVTVPFGRSPGAAEYCVDIARLPTAVGEWQGSGVRSQEAGVRRQESEESAKCTACDCDARDLRGPTPDELAQHTPGISTTSNGYTITPFDVHGGGIYQQKQAKSAKDSASLPLLPSVQNPPVLPRKSWLARLVDWLTRAEHGKAVYSE